MSRIGCSALAIGLALLPAFAETPSIAWDQQKADILRHHRSLIQIDTSNPPGNETKVVELRHSLIRGPPFRESDSWYGGRLFDVR